MTLNELADASGLVPTAIRNIRSYIGHAQFRNRADQEAAGHCVDVLVSEIERLRARPDPINPAALSDLIAMDPAGEIDGGMGEVLHRAQVASLDEVVEMVTADDFAVMRARAEQAEAEAHRLRDLAKANNDLARHEADGRRKLQADLAAEREKISGVVEALEGVTEIAHAYAEYIASVPSQELERHPYLPGVEDAISTARAALAKHKEGK